MRDYAIIIPSCNPSNLRACLDGMADKQSSALDRVFVYDTCPNDGVSNVCDYFHVACAKGKLPFVFSKAINAGLILTGDKDVIILNDDAELLTPNGFDELAKASSMDPGFGIVSAAIKGFVGNPEQKYTKNPSGYIIRPATLHTVVFICVYIHRAVINKIGPLEERLIHYGWEDNLYCLQARAAGWGLGVYDGCVVEHGTLPSTYRTGKTVDLDANWRIFESIVHEKGLEKHWPVPFKFPV